MTSFSTMQLVAAQRCALAANGRDGIHFESRKMPENRAGSHWSGVYHPDALTGRCVGPFCLRSDFIIVLMFVTIFIETLSIGELIERMVSRVDQMYYRFAG